jgi:hypothetical protein
VLAAQAPNLHEALHRVAEEGWPHVIVDGKVFSTDRAAATTTIRKGATIHSWYCGKHHEPGGNIQAIMGPDGLWHGHGWLVGGVPRGAPRCAVEPTLFVQA